MPAETAGSVGVTKVRPSTPLSPSLSCEACSTVRSTTRGPADALLELEGVLGRPLVLEGLVAARSEPSRAVRAGERRDQLGERLPVAGPQDAGAARPEQPLVSPAGQEVAAQVGQVDVDRGEPVHPVDASGCYVVAEPLREISATGTRTPVLECTQVSATTRVFGVTASQQPLRHVLNGRGGLGRRQQVERA